MYGDAVLWAVVVTNQPGAWRYRFTLRSDGCASHGVAQFNDPWLGWVDVAGMELHFVHLKKDAGFVGYTGAMRYAGDGIWQSMGPLATSGRCYEDGVHSHLSGNLGAGSYLYRVNRSGETCWADPGNSAM